VNGHTNSVGFNGSSTPASLASALATNINADTGASVTATSSGATVNLTATTKGTISNYPLIAVPSYDSTHFSKSSFAEATSGSNLTGGWPNPNAIDSGSITVNVNSTVYSVTWGSTATPGSIASTLASAMGSDPAVTPTLSGSTIYLDPKQSGAAYSFSTAYTYDSADFTQSSFTTANSISDYGATSVAVSGHSDSVPWAGHSTSASVAAALASQINGDPAALVKASVSGSAIALTANGMGASTNYALASSSSFDSSHFSSGSFSTGNSGTTLAGGGDAVYKTVFDAGTVWVEVNGFQASTPFQQGSTSASIASALASQFNGTGSPVSATVSGSTLTLTANQKGSVTDYSLSSGATSSQSANFAQPSFAASVSSDTLTGGSDTSPTSQATLYSYDVLNNLTQVTQGSQTRAYSYDNLGRLATSTTPESGTVTNYYTDISGNACAGDAALACRVQDARGVTQTLTYDGINRVTGISYSDGTPPVTYQYDTAVFGQGRLGKITEGSNSHTFTYDNLGRTTADSQVVDGTTYSVQYGYNLASQLTSITYPTGRVVTQNVDAIGRTASISDGSATYLSQLTYNAAAEVLGLTLGNGVQGTFGYNDHLQVSSLRYFNSGNANDILNLAYDYGTSSNNGQIQSVRYFNSPGVEDTTKSEYFSYDLLGRLSAGHTGRVDSTPGTWSLSWGYDRFGNQLSQSLTGGNVSIGQPQLTFDPATNRISSGGFQYDAAGNLTNDSVNAYSYDGANRLTQVNAGTAVYSYFGQLRIKKVAGSTTTVYIYSGNEPIVEYANGVPSKEYIYSGSQLLATIVGTSIIYHHPDHLSNRAETDASGNVARTYGHFPHGENWYETGTPDKWKFTSYEGDFGTGEPGNDYAQARYYAPRWAGFMSPDPLGGTSTAPQSLNRYAYVMNDPVNHTDSSGMVCDDDCIWNDMARAFGGAGDGCTVNGVDAVPCSLATGLVNMGAATICPGGNCDIFQQSFTGDNGKGSYSLVNGVNGLVWINNFNGEELSDEAASEVGLPGFNSYLRLFTGGPANNGQQLGSGNSTGVCTGKVLSAVNNHFGTNFAEANVTSEFQFSTGAPPGQGTLNLNISGGGVSPGRYPVNWWTYIIGYGSTVHIPAGPGGLDSSSTLVFSSSQFTAHLDSAFPYNPFGAVFHLLIDVKGSGGYKACP
jgi:RHS repeat-associated protein